MQIGLCIGLASVLCVASPTPGAAVTLVKDGKAQATIYASNRVMAPDAKDASAFKGDQREAEQQRQRLRESVKDLAHYIERITGARIEVSTKTPAKGTPAVPILVGEPAAATFGPPAKKAPFKQGFRLIVSTKGVGLLGESDLATSYAVYELLDRLGCRWYMPSALGEVIPSTKTLALADVDFSSAPGTTFRGLWYADEAFRRRNRMGGLLLSAGHALEISYLTKEDRDKHPEWRAIIGGKPHPSRLKWSNAQLADTLAARILALHKMDPQPSYSLSPDDGADFDESAEDKALDAGDFDTTNGTPSLTDRLLVLCNRIATKVHEKEPDVLFGMLAYAQYIRAPVREKVHPNLIPQIAPIAFTRHHPMNDDRVPGNKDVRALIEGWGKAARSTSIYFYAYNLAETSAPSPLLAKWSHDVPYVLRNQCQFWQPETLANFDTMLHANYLGLRLAWDPRLKPADVIDEVNTRFYGAAGQRMAAYWNYVDEVWVSTPEYSGCGFNYLRWWTPERMQKARQLMDEAIAACKTPVEQQRVAIANESLKLFELFVKIRRDQAEGRFANLKRDSATWRKTVVALGEKYKDQYCFTRAGWTPDTVSGLYFKSFYQATYEDANRISDTFDLLTPKPIRTFRYQADPDKKGEALGWAGEDFDDGKWKTTDVCLETWSTLGYHDYFKSMWYRTTVDLPAARASKKTYLWLGATDGRAQVFVNGKHVPFVDDKKEQKAAFEGYCQPVSFDISEAIKPGPANRIGVFCTRTFFNELGTGGLIAPAVIYRER